MGRQLRFHKSSALLLRILSAAILIPLSLYIIYAGQPYTLILGGVCSIGLFIEWVFLCLKNKLPFWGKLCCVLLGTFYLGIASLWFLYQLSLPDGWRLIYWLLFLIWSTDTAAYAGGQLLKGPKLASSISPHKTWSGLIIGAIIGGAVGFGTSFWLIPNLFTFWEIFLLVLISQGGDLLESKAKRWSHLKDSSSLIPGHGGLLDRLDSLLAVSFVLALGEILM